MSRSSGSPDPEATRPSKKMRKGTHSCYECRRRKIRCIFSPDSPSVCTECFARGSKCVDQENAEVDISSLDNRKNLRERVAKLEALVQALSQDRPDREQGASRKSRKESAGSISNELPNKEFRRKSEYTVPVTPQSETSATPGYSQNAPVLSIFNDESGLEAGDGEKTSQEIPTSEAPTKQRKIKDSNTRRALVCNLPKSQAELKEAIANSEAWWRFTQRLWHGFCGFGLKTSFARFAEHALKAENPCTLAIFLLCLASANSTDNTESIFTVVSTLIANDDEYAASIEGVECLALIGKYHVDIGQPRKAWLTFRRVITFCQLLGLSRSHSSSARRDTLWWHAYEADRYLSMLLGLPHGFVDSHCEINLDPHPDCIITPATKFRRISATLAGKVVDRNQGVSSQSYSTALDLDQELDNLAARMDPSWWDLTKEAPPDDEYSLGVLYEAKMAQITFFEIRLYLHLPYMLKTASNPRYEFSRNACFEAAKKSLQTYHSLHNTSSRIFRRSYDCRVVDFIGFTSAVVFLLGLLGYGRQHYLGGAFQFSEDPADWRLIERTIEIFGEESSRDNSSVAQQSYETLKFLCKVRDCEGTTCDQKDSDPLVVIPYFGTLRVGRSKFAEIVKQRSASNSCLLTPESQAGCAMQQPSPPTAVPTSTTSMNPADQVIQYNGFYMPEQTDFGTGLNFPMPQGDGGFGGAMPPDANAFSWQNVPNMDIDQDWNWFMTAN
ncbi:MAG: hypothetical protein M1820_008446 [Bogoriella megaspora]|nr:MAG: hypothetical protein M1820_008446 [Bogoriella megaspora]